MWNFVSTLMVTPVVKFINDPFVVDHIALDFPDDNDEHRNGITAWLKPQL